MRRKGTLALACTVAVAAWALIGACGDDSGGEEKPGSDAQVHQVQVEITSPAESSFVAGSVEVRVAVQGVADTVLLIVDGRAVAEAPVQTGAAVVDWDTTLWRDGEHELVVAAGRGGGEVGSSEARRVTVDNTPPEVAVAEPARPYVFTGPTTIALDVREEYFDRAVFLVDGQEVDVRDGTPVSFDWNPGDREDGPCHMEFVVRDRAGNERHVEVRGVVIQHGTIVSFSDGDGSGVFMVPENYSPGMEIDQKFHWDMPTGTTSVLGVLQWDQEPEDVWQLELALGEGFCPHSGTVLGSGESDTGQVVVTVPAPAGGFAEGRHFAHLGPGSELDVTSKKGRGVHYWMVVAVYQQE